MNAPSTSHNASPRRIAALALLLAALFLVAGANSTAPRKVPGESDAKASGEGQSPLSTPEAEDADKRHHALAVGTWQDEYKGKRTMTLHEDGTGTMIVELSGLTARLFAERLEFDMIWSVEDGRMKKQTVGGRPEGKVKAILSMMGDRVDEPILELTGERLLLEDGDGKTRYDWRRAAQQP